MSAEEQKSYMSSDKGKNLDKISASLKADADKVGVKSRFGFFSIAYSAYTGDGFYSQNRKKVYRTADRNVITENRGVFTKPAKKGRGTDVFFSNDCKVDKGTLKRVEEIAAKEREDYISAVRAKKGRGEEDQAGFKTSFKPGGPQEYKDFYTHQPVVYKVPITKEIDNKTKIDKETRNVFTEPRGIMTQPAKQGTSTTPGLLFSTYKDDNKLLQMKAKIAEAEKAKHSVRTEEETKAKQIEQFRPASLMRNETFQKDAHLYGEDEKKNKVLLEDAIEERHKGKPKFAKKLPGSALKQDFPFKPANLGKTGAQGQFKPMYGVPYISHEKQPPKKINKEEKKSAEVPFTYNRIMTTSVFSPPITSFTSNMKKEFPSVFRK